MILALSITTVAKVLGGWVLLSFVFAAFWVFLKAVDEFFYRARRRRISESGLIHSPTVQGRSSRATSPARPDPPAASDWWRDGPFPYPLLEGGRKAERRHRR